MPFSFNHRNLTSLLFMTFFTLVALQFMPIPVAHGQSLSQLRQQRQQYIRQQESINQEITHLFSEYPRATAAVVASGAGISNSLTNYIEEDWGALINAAGVLGIAFCLWNGTNRRNCRRVTTRLVDIGIRLDRVEGEIERLDRQIARYR